MQDQTDLSTVDLTGLPRGQWINAISKIGETEGFTEPLGKRHHAVFIERGDTLLVSFESLPGIEALSDTATPLGWELAAQKGWSSLSVISARDTWFRDAQVYGFFDQLQDDGFFDEFETVLFYGAGPCGYAAGAYSVASPGARVVMLQPQATLDPRVTEWDDRFTEMRRLTFTSRYGYAPDMLDAAQQGYVLYDPHERFDAMHSALFERRNVTRFRLPFMGSALQGDLLDLDLLIPILAAAAEDRLDTLSFARMLRARRDYAPYLRKLLARLEADNRMALAEALCQNVTTRLDAPRFRRRLEALRAPREAS
ncbi:phosphoadenosine phosphosulfate reductase [Salipiger sp. P9]|uniref:phosphoadenosine phosphosulfate reductase n=1 Tax=Salipiger pentaromativorans TaxID=2943193 RepID=UPI0021579A8E|nr:phosphoadenosine phosphosulfate reductase [Salipiger pentaromativorans]MCR8547124.1 phosphoadenosine phosphosulfate reductase [Salipiger pentaromativorans]